jgi:membrane protease YdiL (CAAX protease family)
MPAAVAAPRPAASEPQRLDRLAAAALLVACVPIPLLGIGHPVTRLLVIATVSAFAWLRTRPDVSVRRFVTALDVGAPSLRRGWIGIGALGIGTGLLRFLLDGPLLRGRGGIDFYALLLRDSGVITADGLARWELLAFFLPIVLVAIVIDGIFFVGLIQTHIAAWTNRHLAVLAQALLFALPHVFAGPVPDPAYGVSTFVGGVIYGYLYLSFRNHWLPACMLWLHVATVWILMLATGVG